MPVKAPFQYLPHGEGLPLPSYQTSGAAGMDIMAAVPADQPLDLEPKQWVAVPAGFTIALPKGYEAQIRPRSGLAFSKGITVLNAPGTIDEDYRGEIKVLLINLSSESFKIERGLRIAQMIIAPVTKLEWEQKSELDQTDRGKGGFGSTGL